MRGDRRLPGGSPFSDNVMRWVVGNDMVGVNITHRMLPQAAWPSGADDLGLALRWANAHVAERGDPQRIFVIGHSTGAGIGASYLAQQSTKQGGEPTLAGALASGIGYAIWYGALPGLKVNSAATVQLSVPVIAAVGGAALLGEPLTVRLLLAAVAVLAGIAIAQKQRTL